ncbi:MAG: hypothetical protein JSU57_03385 [Candidatus Heimdallarchaeota archaeon]|nr:MAG: hypothetical protein JSU57_03385 [Candidatus Heimdallarchaeota archaeon]
MAQTLYRNLWASKEVRTLILGTLILSICALLELLFLFFPVELQNSFLGYLFWEIELFDGTFTPLLTLFHLIVWGIMFFSTIMVYTMVREYTGGRTGLLEITGIILIFAVSSLVIYGEWFALYFVGVSALVLGYLYLALTEQ